MENGRGAGCFICRQKFNNAHVTWWCAACVCRLRSLYLEQITLQERRQLAVERQFESLSVGLTGDAQSNLRNAKLELGFRARIKHLDVELASTRNGHQEKKEMIKALKLQVTDSVREAQEKPSQLRKLWLARLQDVYRHLRLQHLSLLQSDTPLEKLKVDTCLKLYSVACDRFRVAIWEDQVTFDVARRARLVAIGTWATKAAEILLPAVPFSFNSDPTGFSCVCTDGQLVSFSADRLDSSLTVMETRAYLHLCSVLTAILLYYECKPALVTPLDLSDACLLAERVALSLKNYASENGGTFTKTPVETATPVHSRRNSMRSEELSRMEHSQLSAGPASPTRTVSVSSWSDDAELRELRTEVSSWLELQLAKRRAEVFISEAILKSVWEVRLKSVRGESFAHAGLPSKLCEWFQFESFKPLETAYTNYGDSLSESRFDLVDIKDELRALSLAKPIEIQTSGISLRGVSDPSAVGFDAFDMRRVSVPANSTLESVASSGSRASNSYSAHGTSASNSWKPRRLSDLSFGSAATSSPVRQSQPFAVASNLFETTTNLSISQSLDACAKSGDLKAPYCEDSQSPLPSESPRARGGWRKRLSSASPIYSKLVSYGSEVTQYFQQKSALPAAHTEPSQSLVDEAVETCSSRHVSERDPDEGWTVLDEP